MRIAFFGSPTSWYLTDLRRAAGDRHWIQPFAFSSLAARIGGGSDSQGDQVLACPSPDNRLGDAILLNDFDAVIVRSMPLGSLEQVIFRMDALARLQIVGVPVINPPRALEIAIDKYLALAKLKELGCTVPETFCCQTEEQANAAFGALGGDVVLKPIFGGEGRGIMRLSDATMAGRAFRTLQQLGAVVYLQRFIPHAGSDVRLLVIGNAVYGMRRIAVDDWRTNISLGARAAAYKISTGEQELALQIAESLQAPIMGLDLLPGLDGKTYALEVNAVPGWQALCRVAQVDIAEQVLSYIRTVANQ